MTTAKAFEIVLANGKFASLRPMKWLDVLIAQAAQPYPSAELLSRIATLDGESFTPEQWTDMKFDDIAPVVEEMQLRFRTAIEKKGIA